MNTSTDLRTRISLPAAYLAIVASVATLLLLALLHVLSPEFAPAWRMVSEYAYGQYGWVLSLMFMSWGISSWALAFAIHTQVTTKGGKIGLWLLVLAGIGEALASVFDITHDTGHSVAQLFGVGGFIVAAIVLSISLGRNDVWREVKKPLLWVAHLSWISMVLLFAALILMTVQMLHVTGGHLPTSAPKALPAGVIGLDGWANRLYVFFSCLWVFLASWQAIRLRHGISKQ